MAPAVPRRVLVFAAAAHVSASPETVASWDYRGQGLEWGDLCQGKHQSPVDLDPARCAEGEPLKLKFLHRPWAFEDVRVANCTARVPCLRFNRHEAALNTVQVGVSSKDFDEYVLTAVELHTPSEHALNHAFFPLELQLWHEPLPTAHLQILNDRVADCATGAQPLDERIADLQHLTQAVRSESSGRQAPWDMSASGGHEGPEGASAETTLSWIDADMARIEDEADALRRATMERLARTHEILMETERLSTAQHRPLAMHRVCLSLFLRSAPEWAASTEAGASQLAQWVADALAARRPASDPVDLAAALGLSGRAVDGGRPFVAYEGSLTYPPCTPNVRWFVATEPLVASTADLELLLAAAKLGGEAGSDGVVGNSRQVQPIDEDTRVQHVVATGEAFELPLVDVDDRGERLKKWEYVRRYSKVFLCCAALIIATPFVFLAKSFFSDEEEDEDGDARAKLHDGDLSGGELSPSSRKGREFMNARKTIDLSSSRRSVGFGMPDDLS